VGRFFQGATILRSQRAEASAWPKKKYGIVETANRKGKRGGGCGTYTQSHCGTSSSTAEEAVNYSAVSRGVCLVDFIFLGNRKREKIESARRRRGGGAHGNDGSLRMCAGPPKGWTAWSCLSTCVHSSIKRAVSGRKKEKRTNCVETFPTKRRIYPGFNELEVVVITSRGGVSGTRRGKERPRKDMCVDNMFFKVAEG